MQRYKLYIPDSDFFIEAKELANFTNYIDIVTDSNIDDRLFLQLDDVGLAIIAQGFKPLYVSEIYSKLLFRQKLLSQELLIQAIKLKTCDEVLIIDATAGLAKDAAILGAYGYKVLMLEYNPILATVVYYALIHQYISSNNLRLIFANSIDYLKIYTGKQPDCIYLDPMFNENKSLSKTKKDMQIIQLLSQDANQDVLDNNQSLFRQAIQISKKVVIKRDNKQENLIVNPKPSYVKLGKTIRYDVYLVAHRN